SGRNGLLQLALISGTCPGGLRRYEDSLVPLTAGAPPRNPGAEADHDALFRAGEDSRGQTTYTPRVVLCDRWSSLPTPLDAVRSRWRCAAGEAAAVSSRGLPVEVASAGSAGAMAASDTNSRTRAFAEIGTDDQGDVGEEMQYAESSFRAWNDCLGTRLPSRSCCACRRCGRGCRASAAQLEEDVESRLRLFAEECDAGSRLAVRRGLLLGKSPPAYRLIFLANAGPQRISSRSDRAFCLRPTSPIPEPWLRFAIGHRRRRCLSTPQQPPSLPWLDTVTLPTRLRFGNQPDSWRCAASAVASLAALLRLGGSALSTCQQPAESAAIVERWLSDVSAHRAPATWPGHIHLTSSPGAADCEASVSNWPASTAADPALEPDVSGSNPAATASRTAQKCLSKKIGCWAMPATIPLQLPIAWTLDELKEAVAAARDIADQYRPDKALAEIEFPQSMVGKSQRGSAVCCCTSSLTTTFQLTGREASERPASPRYKTLDEMPKWVVLVAPRERFNPPTMMCQLVVLVVHQVEKKSSRTIVPLVVLASPTGSAASIHTDDVPSWSVWWLFRTGFKPTTTMCPLVVLGVSRDASTHDDMPWVGLLALQDAFNAPHDDMRRWS
uniref:Ubiquitin-like domain-containing protein n=1 Tax=Macrostomum lignano TaxID=282301 RepID=A0A1I8FA58_9PLAT